MTRRSNAVLIEESQKTRLSTLFHFVSVLVKQDALTFGTFYERFNPYAGDVKQAAVSMSTEMVLSRAPEAIIELHYGEPWLPARIESLAAADRFRHSLSSLQLSGENDLASCYSELWATSG